MVPLPGPRTVEASEAITAPRPSEASIRVISFGFTASRSNSRPWESDHIIDGALSSRISRRIAARTSSANVGEMARSTTV
jgi:hypothetical protein